MRVLHQLDHDLACYGYNQFVVTDTEEKYSIRRVHPCASTIEINQVMERELYDY